jgi:hypothetical protein
VTKFNLPALSPSVSVLAKVTSLPGAIRTALGNRRSAIAPAFLGRQGRPPKEPATDRATDFRQPAPSDASVSVMHSTLLSADAGRRARSSTDKKGTRVPATPIWRDSRSRLAISAYTGRLPIAPDRASIPAIIRARSPSAILPPIKDNDRRHSPVTARSSEHSDGSVAAASRASTASPIGRKINWDQVAAAPTYLAAKNTQRRPLSAMPGPTKADGFDRQGQSSRQRKASAPSSAPSTGRVPARAENELGGDEGGSFGFEDSNGPTASMVAEIHLDGAILGQWVSDHIERLLTHLPTSPTFLDPPSVARQPGMSSRA